MAKGVTVAGLDSQMCQSKTSFMEMLPTGWMKFCDGNAVLCFCRFLPIFSQFEMSSSLRFVFVVITTLMLFWRGCSQPCATYIIYGVASHLILLIAKMSFPDRVSGLTCKNRVTGSDIRQQHCH